MKVTITESFIEVQHPTGPGGKPTDEADRLTEYVQGLMWAIAHIQASLNKIEHQQLHRAQIEAAISTIRKGMH